MMTFGGENKSVNDAFSISQIGKPKRPLTAYNLFFRAERTKMIGVKDEGLNRDEKHRLHRKTHGKVGFQEMAKVVGQRWRQLDAASKTFYQAEASEDIKRYRTDMEVYRQTIHDMGLDAQDTPTKTKKRSIQSERKQSSQRKCEFTCRALKKVKISPVTSKASAPRALDHVKRTLTKALELCQDDNAESFNGKQLPAFGDESYDLERHLRDELESDVFDFLSKIQESSNLTSHPSAESEVTPLSFALVDRDANDKPCEAQSNGNELEPLDWKTASASDDNPFLPCIVPSLGNQFEPLENEIEASESFNESAFFAALAKELDLFL